MPMMFKFLALIAALLLMSPGLVLAHEDRILRIGADGSLMDIPERYGPVKVLVQRSSNDPRKTQKVVLSSPHFRVALNPCLIDKLQDITRIEAQGSWHHEETVMPPYVSITFYVGRYEARGTNNQSYTIVHSLLDGRILMGQRTWDPLIGAPRGKVINPADKCVHWQ